MDDLQKVAVGCINDIESLGIMFGEITEIRFARLRKKSGHCIKYSNNTFCIEISLAFKKEKVDINNLKNAVCHELLHSCPGCQNHGELWIEYAKMLDAVYGYGILTYKSKDDMVGNKPTIHKMRCPNCGGFWDISKHEDWQRIQNGDKSYCAWCDTQYEIVF